MKNKKQLKGDAILVRIDYVLKMESKKVCYQHGMGHSELIRKFLNYIVRKQDIPRAILQEEDEYI